MQPCSLKRCKIMRGICCLKSKKYYLLCQINSIYTLLMCWGAHCTKVDFMGHFQGHQMILRISVKLPKIVPRFLGIQDQHWMLVSVTKKLAKIIKISGGFLTNSYILTFYFIKSSDLLNLNSSGKLILKHPQIKPSLVFQWGHN